MDVLLGTITIVLALASIVTMVTCIKTSTTTDGILILIITAQLATMALLNQPFFFSSIAIANVFQCIVMIKRR